MDSSAESKSRIAHLASVISQSVTGLDDILASQGRPTPSFDPDRGSPTPYPAETDDVRDTIIDAAAELYDLVMEPMALLYKRTGTITRFEIAAMIPVEGEMSFAEIAERIDCLSADMVRRLLRHAMTMRVFREPTPDRVAHTKASRALINPIMNAWLRNGTHEMWPAAVKMLDALEKWPNSFEPSQTGFAMANGEAASAFEILASNPERAARFATAMSIYATKPEYSVAYLTDYYDWASLGPVRVIALGASHLQVAIELLRRFDKLEIIVQDSDAALSPLHSTIPAGLSNRIRLETHDLFAHQTTSGDILLLRWTLHLWSNEYCKRLLRAQIPALKPGMKIIVQDSCMPEPGTVPLWREQDLRASDVHMANLFNGQERTVEEWKSLIREADTGFLVQRVMEPKGSALGIIEVVWRGAESIH